MFFIFTSWRSQKSIKYIPLKEFSKESEDLCDQMAGIFLQCLAIYNSEKLPYSMSIKMPKQVQKFAKNKP